MNYFVNEWQTALFLGSLLLIAMALVLFVALSLWLGERILGAQSKFKNGTAALGFACWAALLFGYIESRDALNHGEVKNLFVLDAESPARLAVISRRDDKGRGAVHHTVKVSSYDLQDGRLIGRATLVEGLLGDFETFGPAGSLLWGHDRKNGLAAIDLSQAAIIARGDELARRVPVLGPGFQLFAGDATFAPDTHSLQVTGADARLYRIDPKLEAIPVQAFTRRFGLKPSEEVRCGSSPGSRATCDRQLCWSLEPVAGSAGRQVVAHRARWSEGGALAGMDAIPGAANPAVLIDPRFVDATGAQCLSRDEARDGAWVSHRERMTKDSALLLSFVLADGTVSMTKNLSAEIGEGSVPLGSYQRDGEAWVFVTRKGFTLVGVRALTRSGRWAPRLDYLR